MEKKDLEFYLICPKCYQQDRLLFSQFKHYVLDEQLEKKTEGRPTLPHRMEGEYPCPYGCKVQMLLFAMGTNEEVDKKSDELFKKYYDKMDPNCCTLQF